MAGSFYYNYLRVGLLVVFIHDITDIFVDTLKLVNYLKLQDRKGLFLSEIAFLLNLGFWVYFRHYVFPFQVIKASLIGGYTSVRAAAAVGAIVCVAYVLCDLASLCPRPGYQMVEGNPVDYWDDHLPLRALFHYKEELMAPGTGAFPWGGPLNVSWVPR